MSKYLDSLKLDAKDELREVLHSEGFKHLVNWLEWVKEDLKEDVMRYDLSSGNDRELALLKARSEGAAKLIKAFKIQAQKAKSAKMT
jgi:hypothetical protein